MIVECTYNDLTGNKPTLNDCDKCREEFELPFEMCCLNNCDDCDADDDCIGKIHMREHYETESEGDEDD